MSAQFDIGDPNVLANATEPQVAAAELISNRGRDCNSLRVVLDPSGPAYSALRHQITTQEAYRVSAIELTEHQRSADSSNVLSFQTDLSAR